MIITKLKVTLTISSLRLIDVITTRLKKTLIMARLMSVTTTAAPEIMEMLNISSCRVRFENISISYSGHSLNAFITLSSARLDPAYCLPASSCHQNPQNRTQLRIMQTVPFSMLVQLLIFGRMFLVPSTDTFWSRSKISAILLKTE